MEILSILINHPLQMDHSKNSNLLLNLYKINKKITNTINYHSKIKFLNLITIHYKNKQKNKVKPKN